MMLKQFLTIFKRTYSISVTNRVSQSFYPVKVGGQGHALPMHTVTSLSWYTPCLLFQHWHSYNSLLRVRMWMAM